MTNNGNKKNRKSLGFSELQWACPACMGINAGTSRMCGNCGAPQPADVAFMQGRSAEVITDKAKVEQIEATQPDIHCAYCGTRNAAANTYCSQCYADLSEGAAREGGQVIGAHSAEAAPDVVCSACGTANAPSNRNCASCMAPLGDAAALGIAAGGAPTATAASTGASNGGRILMIVGALFVLGICLFIGLANRTSESVATIESGRWSRSIGIVGLGPVEYDDWEDEIPVDGDVNRCTERVRTRQTAPDPLLKSVEVCGTPYSIDQGNGFAEVVQDCEYEIYDQWCEFTVQEWVEVDRIEEAGSGFAAAWPQFELEDGLEQGDLRETYWVTFSAEGQQYTYSTDDPELFQQFKSIPNWTLDINTFGDVVNVAPASGR